MKELPWYGAFHNPLRFRLDPQQEGLVGWAHLIDRSPIIQKSVSPPFTIPDLVLGFKCARPVGEPNFGLLDLAATVKQLAYHLPHSDEPWIMRSPPGAAAASSSGSGGAAPPPPPPPPTQPTRTPFGDDPPEGDDDDDDDDDEDPEEEDPEDPDDSEGTDEEEEEPEEWEWRCSLTRAELNVIMERKVSTEEWEIAKNYLTTRLDYIVANNIKDELERHFDNLRGDDDEPAAAPASSAAAAPAAAPAEV